MRRKPQPLGPEVELGQVYRDRTKIEGGRCVRVSSIFTLASPEGRLKANTQYAICATHKAVKSNAYTEVTISTDRLRSRAYELVKGADKMMEPAA